VTDGVSSVERQETTDYTGRLRLDGRSLDIDRRVVNGLTSRASYRAGSSYDGFPSEVFASGIADLSTTLIDYMDLRYGFLSVIDRRSTRTYHGVTNANEPGVIVGSGLVVDATTEIEQAVFRDGGKEIVHSVSGPARRFREGIDDLKLTTAGFSFSNSGKAGYFEAPAYETAVGRYAHDAAGSVAMSVPKVTDVVEYWGYCTVFCGDRDTHSYMELYSHSVPHSYYGPFGYLGGHTQLRWSEDSTTSVEGSSLKEIVPEPFPTSSGFYNIGVIH
jgi:hypothetical protein